MFGAREGEREEIAVLVSGAMGLDGVFGDSEGFIMSPSMSDVVQKLDPIPIIALFKMLISSGSISAKRLFSKDHRIVERSQKPNFTSWPTSNCASLSYLSVLSTMSWTTFAVIMKVKECVF